MRLKQYEKFFIACILLTCLYFFNYSRPSTKKQKQSFEYILDKLVKYSHEKPEDSQCLELPKFLNDNKSNEEAVGKTKFKTIENPRDDFNFILLPLTVLNKIKEINDGSMTVVHMVKSSSGNIDRRNTIRETWGGTHEVRVNKSTSYHFIVFIVGLNDNNEALKMEGEKYGDLLIVDINDTAKNVPLKVLAGMQFASQHLRPQHFYTSVDDDVIVNPLNLHLLLRHMTSRDDESALRPCYEKLPLVCVYSYQPEDIPARNPNSKWYISYDLFGGEQWPPYCRGGLYLMPVLMTSQLYNISRTTSYMHLDDVWITGIMRRRIGAGDTNIFAAPYSERTDTQLIHNTDKLLLSDTVMKHLWGNIHDMKVNVEEEMRKEWNQIDNS